MQVFISEEGKKLTFQRREYFLKRFNASLIASPLSIVIRTFPSTHTLWYFHVKNKNSRAFIKPILRVLKKLVKLRPFFKTYIH